MRADEKLRDACNAFCRGASEERKRKIEEHWDRYDVACKLSRGGDQQRSNYWLVEAHALQDELWRLVKRRAWD